MEVLRSNVIKRRKAIHTKSNAVVISEEAKMSSHSHGYDSENERETEEDGYDHSDFNNKRSRGFFFQQRRGHLNLRSVCQIDMDKLIREVDIDYLSKTTTTTTG